MILNFCSTETGGITLKLPEGSECSGNHCVLSISCKWPLQMKIDAVDILASARHVELFSSSGEYLTTLQGFRVDEELGCHDRLYALQHSFENPVSKFTVKVRFSDLADNFQHLLITNQLVLYVEGSTFIYLKVGLPNSVACVDQFTDLLQFTNEYSFK